MSIGRMSKPGGLISWKSTFLPLLLLGGNLPLQAELLMEDQRIERNGTNVRQISRDYLFKASSLHYRYHLDAESDTLLSGRWGDYFFGLKHGTINNGSWCTWDFLQVNRTVQGRSRNLLKQAPVAKTGMSRFEGGELAEFIWPGGISFRLIQFEAMPDWLFGRVLLPEGEAGSDLNVSLGAWPGGTHWEAPGRERHLVCGAHDLLLAPAPQSIPFAAGQGNAVALYNRNYSERNGNFLVFDGRQVASLAAHAGGGNKVVMTFKPAPGNRVFCFALGYFLDADPGETVSRFLVEQAPNMIDLLLKVDWTPRFDSSGFHRDGRRLEALIHILRKSGEPDLMEQGRQGEQSLTELRQRFAAGEAGNDPGQCSSAWQTLEALRQQLGKAWLDTLK